MKQHVKCFSVRHEYLEMIKKGTKTIEVRVASKYFQDIKEGDILLLYDGYTNIIKARVKKVDYYLNFDDLFDDKNYEDVMPNASSKEKVIDKLREIYGERENLGVIAIELEVLDYIWEEEKKVEKCKEST
ncbi:MAG: ASCH domain-containing protein [Thermococcus sp.]|uniref:ASCH domain-containing protein n=1 Tax=Thermococcus sp. TaxID=35749 RepID=UPI001DD03F2F|nr:ASCH domain-containing protein [Thermococcus sp.]MBO8175294.1 ASCH domain-containing protein [Thermococcus sp.]